MTITLTQPHENAICAINPLCTQLFVVYGGLVRNTPETAMAITKNAGLADRNVIFLNDPHYCSFQDGIGGDVGSLAALASWIEARAAELHHVRETYHVGFSSGGFPALVTACRLGAQQGWAFGARAANKTHGYLDQFRRWMGDTAFAHLPRFFEEFTEDDERRRLEDPEFTAECTALIARLRRPSTRLDYYYCTANASDSRIAASVKDCPGIAFHPVSLSEEQLEILVRRTLARRAASGSPQWQELTFSAAKRLLTHLPLRLMAETGTANDVFPSFARVAVP